MQKEKLWYFKVAIDIIVAIAHVISFARDPNKSLTGGSSVILKLLASIFLTINIEEGHYQNLLDSYKKWV